MDTVPTTVNTPSLAALGRTAPHVDEDLLPRHGEAYGVDRSAFDLLYLREMADHLAACGSFQTASIVRSLAEEAERASS